MIFVFVLLTPYDNLQVCPYCYKWHYFILFYGWVIFYCICIPHHLYPFLCWWTFRLLLCPGYCKSCCNENVSDWRRTEDVTSPWQQPRIWGLVSRRRLSPSFAFWDKVIDMSIPGSRDLNDKLWELEENFKNIHSNHPP